MSGWFLLIRALVDFAVKAMVAFAQTPDGLKEWQDVEARYETLLNNEDLGGDDLAYKVRRASEVAQAASPNAQTVDAPQEGKGMFA